MHIHGLAGLYIGLLAMTAVAGTGTTTLDAVDRGNYGSGGGHVPSNLNYIAGDVTGPSVHRNFFVFDLNDLPSGRITTAQFRFRIDNYFGDDPFETYALYDIDTPFDMLLDGSAKTDGFADLGSGIEYGRITVSNDDDDSFVIIDLNEAAIASLNTMISSSAENLRWGFGGSIETLDEDSGTVEGILGDSRNPLSDTQLIVMTIPGAGVLALFGIAAYAPTRRRNRRSRTASGERS